MASPMFRSSVQGESSPSRKLSGGAQSRSTSAGSVPSDGQSTSAGYPNDIRGLPEYDYPTPWSIKSPAQLQELDFPSPLIVKNTFIDFDVWRSPSLEEFYKERQTRSCPGSGVSLPPGLKDLFEPEETAAKIAAVEATLRREAQITELTQTKTMPLPMEAEDHFLPSGLLDDVPIKDDTLSFFLPPPPQPPAFDITWQSPVSPAPLYTPTAFDDHWQAPMSLVPPHVSTFDIEWRLPEPLAPLPARKEPVVFSLMQALSSPLPAVQEGPVAQQSMFFADQFAAPGFCIPPMQTTDLPASEPQAELGSPECPTVGSQNHWLGACKPCAFLHTKGCDNGVLCPFCHICDKGEKKRRAKDKRFKQNRC